MHRFLNKYTNNLRNPKKDIGNKVAQALFPISKVRGNFNMCNTVYPWKQSFLYFNTAKFTPAEIKTKIIINQKIKA